MTTTTLEPTRMSCASIAGTVKGVLSSMEGVKSVEVEYEKGVFVVSYDETKVTPDDMIAQIGLERGIGVRVVA